MRIEGQGGLVISLSMSRARNMMHNTVRALRANTYYRLVGLAGRFGLEGVPASPRSGVQRFVVGFLPCTGFVAERAGLGGDRGGVWHERAIDGERHELVVDTRCMSMRFHRHTDRPGPPRAHPPRPPHAHPPRPHRSSPSDSWRAIAGVRAGRWGPTGVAVRREADESSRDASAVAAVVRPRGHPGLAKAREGIAQ